MTIRRITGTCSLPYTHLMHLIAQFLRRLFKLLLFLDESVCASFRLGLTPFRLAYIFRAFLVFISKPLNICFPTRSVRGLIRLLLSQGYYIRAKNKNDALKEHCKYGDLDLGELGGVACNGLLSFPLSSAQVLEF